MMIYTTSSRLDLGTPKYVLASGPTSWWAPGHKTSTGICSSEISRVPEDGQTQVPVKCVGVGLPSPAPPTSIYHNRHKKEDSSAYQNQARSS